MRTIIQKRIHILFLLLLSTFSGQLWAQKTTSASLQDTLKLSIQEYRGELQWQVSYNLEDWSSLQNETSSALSYWVDQIPLYLRLRVVEGTCDTIYSEILEVELLVNEPLIVSTTPISQISSNSAVSGGNISGDGNHTIVARGVVYDTDPNPTLQNNFTNDGAGAGGFISNLLSLEPSTVYYVRAYATDSEGTTVYGAEISFSTSQAHQAENTVLLFVSHEQTYYSEYIVMRKALEAAGYSVDVRSSNPQPASIYMSPYADIPAVANDLPGSSYGQFANQFQDLFGANWEENLNDIPATVPVDGRIQDVVDMSGYRALIVAGGLGALEYRVDGSYNSQGEGGRMVSAVDVQAASEKLNALAIDALIHGKPVMAQCHAASLPAFWRIPETSGSDAEALGFSILKGQWATGFPEAETTSTLSSLDITHRASSLSIGDRVTIANPHSALDDQGEGEYKIITTRDWYPQTIAHAARTILNIIETYPSASEISIERTVLILHGGAVDEDNCSAGNRANDVPCNYGNSPNELPADYTDLVTLLGDSPSDDFVFVVSESNITSGSFPTSEADILNYLDNYDVVIFFKHWSTGVTEALQNAIVDYADNGGGVLALHHGLYNDVEGGVLNKDILANQLFGAESSPQGWSANRTTHQLFSTNYGHFISTYQIPLSQANPSLQAPTPWGATPLIGSANTSFSYYQNFEIYDEIYNNMSFVAGQVFGRDVNEITPLFSNNLNPSNQCHTAGFVKLFNQNGSDIGKVAFFQAGERKESLSMNHRYGKVVRNAIVWLSN